jgi:hypothetical protein
MYLHKLQYHIYPLADKERLVHPIFRGRNWIWFHILLIDFGFHHIAFFGPPPLDKPDLPLPEEIHYHYLYIVFFSKYIFIPHHCAYSLAK